MAARAARLQGTVRLHAIIARDGSIENLTVVSGPAMLIKAAMQAVEQWRYSPTLLNGLPVEVDTVVDVHFNLGE
jgi:protein TonB